MTSVWPLFISFLFFYAGFQVIGLTEIIGEFLSSKLLLIITIFPAFYLAFKQQIPQIAITSQLSKLLIKAKKRVFTLFLTIILIYSHAMASFGILPFGYFTVEYTLVFPILLILLPWFTRYTSARQFDPEDEYARLGYCLLGTKKFFWNEHKEVVLKCLVKIIFIPIMTGGLFHTTESLLMFDWHLKPLIIVSGLFIFGLAFDLLIATVGYVFSCKILKNDVESTEPHLSGWIVCLLCYPPLLTIFHAIKQQTDNQLWYHWLHTDNYFYWFWATILTVSWIVYWLSTASFGWKFSNLTWRGLVNTGPYAYTKHPAYIAKNIYWWMHTVPFFGVSTTYEMVRNLAGMVFVSAIYYLRAKTEERHLMAFKEYQDYAAYIEQYGIFSRLKKVLFRLRTST